MRAISVRLQHFLPVTVQGCVEPLSTFAYDPVVLGPGCAAQLGIGGVVWGLVKGQRSKATSLLMPHVQLGRRSMPARKYVALGEACLFAHRRCSTQSRCVGRGRRRAFRPGEITGVLVSDADGQQLLNTFAQPGQALPRRNSAGVGLRAASQRVDRDNAHAGFGCRYRGSHLQERPALSRLAITH